ncbi:MAG: hypothetical protein KTR18_04995 [Acidiferrobacterales bacterium]|nr:hypothetical protein [Acidiferrobacterales bacterium]
MDIRGHIKTLFVAAFVSLLVSPGFSFATEKLNVCVSEDSKSSSNTNDVRVLPQRKGPRVQTSGRVPHTQINIEPTTEIYLELQRLAFSLPGVEKRPTIVSLPGTDGLWLLESLPLANSKAIVSGREFAHIHPDGSLHAPLPFQRALEISEKRWGERHPWADNRDGWEGLVMLYTPQSREELDVVFQLILESYNYVTGKRLIITEC